jgi:drug/metabolite transporter (DMT)-like permease
MAIAVFCFAIMNVAIKFLPNYTAIELVFYRALVTLIISGYYLHKRKVSIKGNNTMLLVLRGVFGFSGLFLYYATVQQMNLASAVVLQYTSPLFTMLLALFILKEKILSIQWFAFAMCLAGLFMIRRFGEIDPLYFGLGILSALFSGAAYNVIRRLKTSESPNLIVFYFPLVTLPVATVVLVIQGHYHLPTWKEGLLLLLIGISTQIAQYTMTIAYQREVAAKVASVTYTGLGYALFFGFVIFNEKPGYLEIVGFSIVVVGVLINIYAPKLSRLLNLKS